MARDVKEIHEDIMATFTLLARLIDEIEPSSELPHYEIGARVDEIATMLDEIYDVPESDEADDSPPTSMDAYQDELFRHLQRAISVHYGK